ncbi:aspartyl protease family protein At5g10770 [Brachypodium distachyon]|uniref:aspartyl protease family protein At5g10770 n=1 Tax=Brachypodium distachyon TaxID=15368 RepID=UPI00052FEF28|nr:aspartyl protease family protein At5g10770 [Brachypodium distachyon]|eukprot:XP_010233410.1 aspartyl protease family protein At5g10770 [Brachypodium distachyon]
MPVNAVVGHGFVAQVALGTPPTTQTVLIDTAASFSWVQCSPCGARNNNGCYYNQDVPLFDSQTSSTYTAGAQYMDRSVSEGSLSRETLTIGQDNKFPGFVFGCSRRYEAPFGRYSAIFGFANDRLSFFSQVVDKSRQYRAFSYCYLPSPTSVGFIQVGSYDDGGLAFTPMFTKGQDYFLALTDITVGQRQVLRAPDENVRV